MCVRVCEVLFLCIRTHHSTTNALLLLFSNRKGKIIFFYEWEIKLKWKSVPADSEHSIKGTVEIPNLSEENDIMNDVDVSRTPAHTAKDGFMSGICWVCVFGVGRLNKTVTASEPVQQSPIFIWGILSTR